MKPCPNCHQPMGEGTLFCPHCGFRLATPVGNGKLLTGAPVGDVIVGIILHSLIVIALNFTINSLVREFADYTILCTPLFSGIVYYLLAWKLKYKSLGAGVYWTYIVAILGFLVLFVILLGVCLIGGVAASRFGH